MKYILSLCIMLLAVTSCTQKNNTANILAEFKDSIISHSDSSYQKPYYRTDFVAAEYYLNKKDSTVSQFMKDSAGMIRQIIITKKGVRTFFGSYYKNGQIQASLPLDEFGQFHGTGTFYYEDGSIQSSGNYTHGFKNGTWKVYDEKGQITASDSYDSNGNLVPQKQP